MSFTQLGTFITMAYIMPGIVITTALCFLFPNCLNIYRLLTENPLFAIGVVCFVSFLSNVLGMFVERFLLILWCAIYRQYRLNKKRAFWDNSPRILVLGEFQKVEFRTPDSLSGEYVFLFNTSCALFLLSLSSLILLWSDGGFCEEMLWQMTYVWEREMPTRAVFLIPGIIFSLSTISLFCICPYLFNQICDMLREIRRFTKNPS